jgi:hypothetical protein
VSGGRIWTDRCTREAPLARQAIRSALWLLAAGAYALGAVYSVRFAAVGPAPLSWSDLRLATMVLAAKVVRAAVWDLVHLMPIGALVLLAVPRRGRARWGFLPLGVLGALVLAAVVVALERPHPHFWPGPVELLLPLAGCLLAALVTARLTGGRSVVRTTAELCGVTVLAAVALAVLVLALAQDHPLDLEPAHPTTADRRRLYQTLTAHNPAALPAGKTATLRLSAEDLDLLAAWAMAFTGGVAKATLDPGPDELTWRSSARIPLTGRFLNVVLRTGVALDPTLSLDPRELKVGSVAAGPWSRWLLSALVRSTLRDDPRAERALAPLRDIQVDTDGVRVTYGHGSLPGTLVGELIHGERAQEDLRAEVRAQVQHLLGQGTYPTGDRRFVASLERAFAFARERSAGGKAVLENRAAVVALGILIGSRHVERLVGPVLEPADRSRARTRLAGTTLRGRTDWPQHFWVSGSLTVLATDTVSAQGGVLKEELDAVGEEGFSFGDLLADRAGTAFATEATRDEDSARSVQERLARGIRVDDVFPPAADLPEGLRDRDLQTRYGGVGGAGYRAVLAEMDRRLSRCSLLNPSSASSRP